MKFFLILGICLLGSNAFADTVHPGCMFDDPSELHYLKNDPMTFWNEVLLKNKNCSLGKVDLYSKDYEHILFIVAKETGRYGFRHSVGQCLKYQDKISCDTLQAIDY